MRHQGQSSCQKDFRTGVAAEQLHSRPGRISKNLSLLFLFSLTPSFVFNSLSSCLPYSLLFSPPSFLSPFFSPSNCSVRTLVTATISRKILSSQIRLFLPRKFTILKIHYVGPYLKSVSSLFSKHKHISEPWS
jgi:hypothetical protein